MVVDPEGSASGDDRPLHRPSDRVAHENAAEPMVSSLIRTRRLGRFMDARKLGAVGGLPSGGSCHDTPGAMTRDAAAGDG